MIKLSIRGVVQIAERTHGVREAAGAVPATPTSKPVLVSVIIITKNQRALLEKTVPALLKQNLDRNNYEIIVVDSGSTDGAKKYINSQRLRLVEIKPDKFNYAAAFNSGAKIAKGKFLIRLSGDCIPLDNKLIASLISPFKDTKIGGTFGRYEISHKAGFGYPDYWPASRFPKKQVRYTGKPVFLQGISIVDIFLGYLWQGPKVFEFAGGCCAIRKNIWDQRPFNEKLPAAEDAEYAYFLHTIGYDIVYTPKARVLHEHQKNPAKTFNYSLSYLGFSKFQMAFNYEIAKYWFRKITGKKPYEELTSP